MLINYGGEYQNQYKIQWILVCRSIEYNKTDNAAFYTNKNFKGTKLFFYKPPLSGLYTFLCYIQRLDKAVFIACFCLLEAIDT